MSQLQITYRQVSALHARCNNPRTHSRKQIAQVASSIQRFGFTNPVLIDDHDGIVAGHGRVEAAKLLNMMEVPTVCLRDMSEADVRAYVIADNKLAENAGWDRDLLKQEFKYLSELDIDFDMTLTGFDLAEIDGLIDGVTSADAKPDPTDNIPAIPETPAITRAGDVWRIGRHRLICGDATDPDVYPALLAGEKAAMVFCDPPYNVRIDGHVSGLGKTKHREFAMASGEMSEAEFTDFLASVFRNLVAASADGAIHFQCMDWRHIGEMLKAGLSTYSELKNLCVWSKTNGGMGSLYRSAHELVFVFKSGTAPHINNVELGRNGRYRTNVWSYAGANSFGTTRDDDLSAHPTVKPVAMVVDAILDCSRRKDIVLDAFAGSGTTLLAAHRTGRRGYGIELDPRYCDVTIRRLQKLSKAQAVRVSDDASFDALAERVEEASMSEAVA